jgi:hypothetical protein
MRASLLSRLYQMEFVLLIHKLPGRLSTEILYCRVILKFEQYEPLEFMRLRIIASFPNEVDISSCYSSFTLELFPPTTNSQVFRKEFPVDLLKYGIL